MTHSGSDGESGLNTTASTSSSSSYRAIPSTPYSDGPTTSREETWSASLRDGRLASRQANSLTSSVESIISYSDLDAVELAQEVEVYSSDALPTTSEQFSELWESTNCLRVRHDDSTSDGNMNLRIDAIHSLADGMVQRFTLFHLRMRNLKTREFVLRRQGRASGKDICCSKRVLADKIPQRPSIARSLSSVISKGLNAAPVQGINHRRYSSGHDSMTSMDNDRRSRRSSLSTTSSQDELSDTICIEFMNYQRIWLDREGREDRQRYSFEYWGDSYAWKHCGPCNLNGETAGFALYRKRDGAQMARIVADQLSATEAAEETLAGGWVPPCTFWLSGSGWSTDIGDIVIATGLLSLVDSAIRCRFCAAESRPPATSKLAPTRWFGGAFGRTSRPTTAG